MTKKTDFHNSLTQINIEELASKFGVEPKGHALYEDEDGRTKVVKIKEGLKLFRIWEVNTQEWWYTKSNNKVRAYNNCRRRVLKRIGKYKFNEVNQRIDGKWVRILMEDLDLT